MEQLSLMLKNSNLVRYLPTVIIPAIGDTLKMVFISAALSIFFGIFYYNLQYSPKQVIFQKGWISCHCLLF